MNITERIQLLVGVVIVVLGSLYLSTTGTLQIRPGKIATDLGVLATPTSAVSGSLLISPYDAKDEILSYIAETKYHLDGRWYQITDTDVTKVLQLQAGAGVASRMIIERATYGGNTKSWDTLNKKLGTQDRIQIKSDDHLGINFNHTKVRIRDDTDVMIATANLSYSSFARNREYRVVVNDQGVVDSIRQLFEDDWSESETQMSEIHPSLLVCPYNCRPGLIGLLDDVQSSVHIQAQYISDDGIIQRLRQLHESGVEVQLLVGEYQEEEKLGGLNYHIQNDLYNHSKALLIDGEKLLIGSMNYSTNSIENNREISVLLDNPQALGLFKRQFENDRTANE